MLVTRTVIRAYSSHLTCIHSEPVRSVHISYTGCSARFALCFNGMLVDEFAYNSYSVNVSIFNCHLIARFNLSFYFFILPPLLIEVILNATAF